MSVFFGGSRDHILSKKMPTRCCYVLEKIFNPQRHTLARSPGAEESPKTRRIESVQ